MFYLHIMSYTSIMKESLRKIVRIYPFFWHNLNNKSTVLYSTNGKRQFSNFSIRIYSTMSVTKRWYFPSITEYTLRLLPNISSLILLSSLNPYSTVFLLYSSFVSSLCPFTQKVSFNIINIIDFWNYIAHVIIVWLLN